MPLPMLPRCGLCSSAVINPPRVRVPVSLGISAQTGKVHDPADFLTCSEVCATLRIHRDTVLAWTQAGKLSRVVLSPRVIRYRRSDVNALLVAQNYSPKRKPGPKPKQS